MCDYGIFIVDDLGNEELVEICNSQANANTICDIFNADLMKDGAYTIWKDQQITMLEKALELAVSQLDDAKDMLRDTGKPDWANTLDTSVDYFKARAKEMKYE